MSQISFMINQERKYYFEQEYLSVLCSVMPLYRSYILCAYFYFIQYIKNICILCLCKKKITCNSIMNKE